MSPNRSATLSHVLTSSPAARARGCVASLRTWADAAATALARHAPLVALAALALLVRPYLGIYHDAQIYIGRAVADLDPQGVGRDLMYAHDGQSEFSLFPRLLILVVAALGPARASAGVAAAALAVWCLAAGAFLGALAGRGWRLPMLAAALALPCGYGGFPIGFGEVLALPRPFAEALVLAAFWAFLRERRGLALALLLAATAMHPIMAAPGWAVLLVLLGLEDRRWWAAGAAAAAAGLLGAWLHAPLLGRLLVPMDAEWAGLVAQRAPFVFLHLWLPSSWAQTATQFTAVLVAASVLDGRARRVLLAVSGVAAAALLASAVLGDAARSLLVLQLQPWRAVWLLAVAATAATPVLAAALWRRGGCARLATGALLLAWGSGDLAPLALAACGAAVALLAADRRGLTLGPAARRFGWAWVLALAGVVLALQTQAVATALAAGEMDLAGWELHALPLLDPYRAAAVAGALAAVAFLRGQGGPTWLARLRPYAGAGGLAALGLGLAAWDARSGPNRVLDDPASRRRLHAIVAAQPGEVEWLGGWSRAPLLAGRANWQSELQGAGVVFARERGMEWRRRTRRLIALHMGDPALLAPLAVTDDRLPTPSPSELRTFCADPGAPAWLVVPVAPGVGPDYPALADAVWRSPASEPLRTRGPGGADVILHVDRYAFIACHRLSPAGAGPR